MVDKKNFEEIRRGLKTIETRAATKKYREIRSGDILQIVCGKQKMRRRVKKAQRFRSIGEMTAQLDYRKIMPSVQSVSEMRASYYGYSGYREKIKKVGLIALHLKEITPANS